MNYIIITPAYNEEEHIGQTILSVVKQTVLPAEWVIVNDGSTDNTASIVLKYAEKFKWIKLVNKQKEPVEFGKHAVQNFYFGLNKLSFSAYDILVKLDADLILDRADYFEYQINQFKSNPKLGISSGITYHTVDGIKKVVWHPAWRTTGAMKMYRKKCFDEIGGLVPVYGWDGLDDYKAMHKGWQARTFYELEVNHLGKKRDINRHSTLNIYRMKGESYYVRGYSFLFILLKSIRYFIKGNFAFGYAQLKGFINAMTDKKIKKVVTASEQRFIRMFQVRRLLSLEK